MRRPTLALYIKSILWMIFGVVFVFGTVIMMNEAGGVHETKKKASSASFEIQKMVKPKPKPKPKPKKKPRKAQHKRSAPTPNMSSSLSGIDTGLDAFASDDMGMDDTLLGDVGKDVVMTGDSVDVKPKPAQRSAMEYPKSARKGGVTGYVLMNLLINKSGQVEKVKVLQSEPAGVFDDVAKQGVRSWVFSPAQYKGQNVKVWAKQKIRFDLQ